MNRVWTALLLLATIVVAGAVVYVVVHDDPVPGGGTSPGLPTVSTTATPSGSGSVTSGSGAPSSGSTGSAGVTNPTGSTDTASAAIHSIAFLGDNWTKGVKASSNAKRFPDLIGSALGVDVTVVAENKAGYAKAGVDGDNYNDLVQGVIDAQPDMVVVSGGRNDRSDDHTTLDSAVKDLFSTLAEKLPNAKLVAVKPFFGDSAVPSDMEFVGTDVQSAVEANGGTYLDLRDPIFNHPTYMANDNENPNDLGNKAIADALTRVLKPLAGVS